MLGSSDRERLEAAYRTFGPKLWRALLGYCGGAREIADDAVAEAFAQAGRHLAEIRQLERWLFTAAFRIASGELKRRGSLEELPTGTHASQDWSTGLTELLHLVGRLRPVQRQVFVLRDLLGYSSKETARLIGRSDAAVRVHLVAARRRLRGELEEVNDHA